MNDSRRSRRKESRQMTLQIILVVVAGVLLFLYIARRRARLRNDGSNKN